MRILEIIPQLGPGGAERVVADLCCEFSAMGHDVTLLLFFTPPQDSPLLTGLPPQVEVTSLSKRKGPDISLMFSLRRYVKRLRPDVVHTHLEASLYLPALAGLGIRIFHTLHNQVAIEAGPLLRRSWKRMVYTLMDVRLAGVSEAVASFSSRFYRRKVSAVANGRSPFSSVPESDKLNTDADSLFGSLRAQGFRHILLNVATLSPVKNQLSLARALTAYNVRHPDRKTALVIAGQIRQSVAYTVLKAGAGSVVILGPLPDVRQLMERADIFVLPSLTEGFPIVLIEAMRCGLPILTTPFPGVDEILTDGIEGIVASGFGEKELYDALVRMLSHDPASLHDMSIRAKQKAEHMTSARSARSYLRLFSS